MKKTVIEDPLILILLNKNTLLILVRVCNLNSKLDHRQAVSQHSTAKQDTGLAYIISTYAYIFLNYTEKLGIYIKLITITKC